MNSQQATLTTPARVSPRLLRIDWRDNVAVALVDLAASAQASVGEANLLLKQAVPFGHKVALLAITKGSPIIKYGEQIGIATSDIAAGEHVHVHNVESTRGRGDLATVNHHANV